jgi:hypothetical protein
MEESVQFWALSSANKEDEIGGPCHKPAAIWGPPTGSMCET